MVAVAAATPAAALAKKPRRARLSGLALATSTLVGAALSVIFVMLSPSGFKKGEARLSAFQFASAISVNPSRLNKFVFPLATRRGKQKTPDT
jgi:hypothetical protein